jgi:hypothetical protein
MSKTWLEQITERVASYRANYLERLEQNKTRAARIAALKPAWEEYNELSHQEETEQQEGRNSSKWWRSILAASLMDLEDAQRKEPLPTLSDWIPPGADIRESHDRLLTGPRVQRDMNLDSPEANARLQNLASGSAGGKSDEMQRLAAGGAFIYGPFHTFQSMDSGRYSQRLADTEPVELTPHLGYPNGPCAHERRFPTSGACVACGEPGLTGQPG